MGSPTYKGMSKEESNRNSNIIFLEQSPLTGPLSHACKTGDRAQQATDAASVVPNTIDWSNKNPVKTLIQ